MSLFFANLQIVANLQSLWQRKWTQCIMQKAGGQEGFLNSAPCQVLEKAHANLNGKYLCEIAPLSAHRPLLFPASMKFMI